MRHDQAGHAARRRDRRRRPSATSAASIVTISAPRSVASSRYSRSRRFALRRRAGVGRRLDDDREQRRAQDARRSPPPGAARAASPATSSTRTRTRSVTGWRSRAVPIPSSCASTRPATNRRASSRSAVRLDSVKNRSSAIRARSSRIDVAVAHPLAQRERAHVDELDLVGGGEDLVRDPLVDRRPGDGRDGVRDRVEVLDVAGADDIDARRRGGRSRPPSAWSAPTRARWCGRARRPGRRSGPARGSASVSISSTTTPRYSTRRRGTISRPSSSFSVSGRPCASTNPTTRSVPRFVRRWPSSSIRYVLPTPGAMPR